MPHRSKRCSAKNCGVNSISNPGLSFFNFPRRAADPVRFAVWCAVAGIASGQPSSELCERHFGVDQFRLQGLVYRAVPKYPAGPCNAFTSNYAPLTPQGKQPATAIGTVGFLKIHINTLFDFLNGYGLKPEGYLGMRFSISLLNEDIRLGF